MSDYEKINELADSNLVLDGINLPRIKLHKWLVLGQTEYVCEHGTLSEGHEKLVPAQHYAQALKEYYYLSCNIRQQQIVAKKAQADLLEAKEALDWNTGVTPSSLRLEAKKEDAELRLFTALVTIEDQMRMVRFYKKKIDELAPIVEEKYPKGIEQAEKDNWTAVAEFRTIRRMHGINESFLNIPLPADEKAKIGIETKNPSLAAWLLVKNRDDLQKRKISVEDFLEKKMLEWRDK